MQAIRLQQLREWQGLVRAHVPQARQMLAMTVLRRRHDLGVLLPRAAWSDGSVWLALNAGQSGRPEMSPDPDYHLRSCG